MAHEAASCLGIFSKHKLRKQNCIIIIIILLFEQTITIGSERDTVERFGVSVCLWPPCSIQITACLLGLL